MQDREKWSPLLKEDVDHLVRHQTWRCLEGDNALWASRSFDATRSEEGVRTDICRQSACLLGLLLESLCSALATVSGEGGVKGEAHQQASVHWSCLQSRNRG
jgi:hypothetical protein